MYVIEFMSELGLVGDSLPTSVRWFMADTQAGASASASLDVGAAGAIEFSVYENVGGESSVMTGRAAVKAGEITFHDDDELLFERFAETVRLMQQEVPEGARDRPGSIEW